MWSPCTAAFASESAAPLARLPDPSLLAAGPALAALNHLLAGQPWLRERLMPFAGCTVLLEVFPAALRASIGADGAFSRSDAEPQASIRMSPLTLMRLQMGDERARNEIATAGDGALAATVGGVLRELRWDAEEDLSRIIGDVAAHRLSETAKAAMAWPGAAAASFAGAAAEYLTEEQPLIARKDDLQRWIREVDELREAVDRLDKRLEKLQLRRAAPGPTD